MGHPRRAHHHHQGDGHDEIPRAGACRRRHQRRQHIAPREKDYRHGARRLHQRRDGEIDYPLALRPQKVRGQQDRHHHEILEQQHGDDQLAERRKRAPLGHQKLRDHGGGGQRQREAQHQREAGLAQRQIEQAGQRHGAEQHLQEADAEHLAAQGPQPPGGKFQPQQEQQEDNPQLAEGRHPLRAGDGDEMNERQLCGEVAEAVRPKQRAHRDEPHHRADTCPLEQGNDHTRRDQIDHGVLQDSIAHRPCASARGAGPERVIRLAWPNGPFPVAASMGCDTDPPFGAGDCRRRRHCPTLHQTYSNTPPAVTQAYRDEEESICARHLGKGRWMAEGLQGKAPPGRKTNALRWRGPPPGRLRPSLNGGGSPTACFRMLGRSATPPASGRATRRARFADARTP